MFLPSVDTALDHMRRDAEAGRFAVWGQSTLIDEFTGVPSIEKDLFDTLHAAAGIDAEFPIGNAGVLHVYGYWFSEVPTPFGYKRDRWADGALAQALGLEPDAFHLTSGSGTAGADSGTTGADSGTTGAGSGTTLLERVTAAVLPALISPPANAHSADVPVGDVITRVVTLSPRAGTPSALVYGSAPVSAPTDWRLITTFPLASDPAAMVAECIADPRLRFNAA
ncbi:amino acid deaminase [Microbacterium sp. NC79]|uniref:amino acid deaminase n=1 Tax=Microbacterium sp. NC79 TaxID=2851009 RepID=UPI001C2C099C|nr:amino acid deaminase [Microbacterium sp. NC79]MBV0896112.1 amino acid deaminase [Microbacterium sp. NC79]